YIAVMPDYITVMPIYIAIMPDYITVMPNYLGVMSYYIAICAIFLLLLIYGEVIKHHTTRTVYLIYKRYNDYLESVKVAKNAITAFCSASDKLSLSGDNV